MDTTEICRLTPEALKTLLAGRDASRPEDRRKGERGSPRRRAPRWPFPGTVELWIPDDVGRQWHTLATSVNLSESGIGLRCEQRLAPGTELDIAIHEPEVSFHGRAVVRHCSPGSEENFMVGLQFVFDKA